MGELNNILIFVEVAQFESITRAARSLGDDDLDVEPSAVRAGIGARRTTREALHLESMRGFGGASFTKWISRRWSDRAARLVQVLVLAGADQQA